MEEEKTTFWGTGRRKSAVARVRIKTGGSGQFLINKKKKLDDFVQGRLVLKKQILRPFQETNRTNAYDVFINVTGGGVSGQAGAVAHGIARALISAEPELRKALKAHHLLTRDSRIKERKKYGQPGARKRFQYSKR